MSSTNTPWWVVVVAMAIVGMITAMAIFTGSNNEILAIAIAAIVTLAGVTYGLDLRRSQNATITQKSLEN